MRAEYYGERTHKDTVAKGLYLLKEYINEGWIQKPTVDSPAASKKAISINGDGSQSSEGKFVVDYEDSLKDPKYLLKLHGYDPTQWNLVNSKNSFWDTQMKGGAVKTLYSSKVTVKPKCGLDYSEIIEHFESFSKDYCPNDITPKQYEYGAECLVPCLFDVHFGKLADMDETGNRYDYKIARDKVLNSLSAYINKLKDRRFEQIVFVIGNDFFNSESNGETVNNTRQDNDSRYSKLFNKGVETLIQSIDMLSTVAPVCVLLVQGNHDFYTSFYCASVLSAWYRNSSVVSVNSSPTVRKYIRFGKNLLGFTHGSEEKDRIYGLMQCEASEDWGKTTTHEWLIGHLHSEGITEKNGVVVRRIPSLTGDDAWHTKSGYTTSKKRSMAFIYDKEDGLVETYYSNI